MWKRRLALGACIGSGCGVAGVTVHRDAVPPLPATETRVTGTVLSGGEPLADAQLGYRIPPVGEWLLAGTTAPDGTFEVSVPAGVELTPLLWVTEPSSWFVGTDSTPIDGLVFVAEEACVRKLEVRSAHGAGFVNVIADQQVAGRVPVGEPSELRLPCHVADVDLSGPAGVAMGVAVGEAPAEVDLAPSRRVDVHVTLGSGVPAPGFVVGAPASATWTDADGMARQYVADAPSITTWIFAPFGSLYGSKWTAEGAAPIGQRGTWALDPDGGLRHEVTLPDERLIQVVCAEVSPEDCAALVLSCRPSVLELLSEGSYSGFCGRSPAPTYRGPPDAAVYSSVSCVCPSKPAVLHIGAEVEIPVGVDQVSIDLGDVEGELLVRVVGAPHARVSIERSPSGLRSEPLLRSMFTQIGDSRRRAADALGVARFPRVGEGKWTVHARLEGRGEATVEVEVSDGPVDVTLELPPP